MEIIQYLLNDNFEVQQTNYHTLLQLNTTILFTLISLIFIPYQFSKYKDQINFNPGIIFVYLLLVVYGLIPALGLLNFSTNTSVVFKASYLLTIFSTHLLLIFGTILFYWSYKSISIKSAIDQKVRQIIRKKIDSKQKGRFYKYLDTDDIGDDFFLQEIGNLGYHEYEEYKEIAWVYKVAIQAQQNDDLEIFEDIISAYASLIFKDDLPVEYKQFLLSDLSDILKSLINSSKYNFAYYAIDKTFSSFSEGDSISIANITYWLTLIESISKSTSNTKFEYEKIISLTKLGILLTDTDFNKWPHKIPYNKISKVGLNLSKQDRGYSFWYLQEAVLWMCRRYASKKDLVGFDALVKIYGRLGLVSRVYGLHCEARNCPKSNYDHIIEGFTILQTWSTKYEGAGLEEFSNILRENLAIATGYKIDKNFNITKVPKKIIYFRLNQTVPRENYEIEIDCSAIKLNEVDKFINQHEF